MQPESFNLFLKCADGQKVEMDSSVLAKHSVLVGNVLDSCSKIEEYSDKVLPFHNIKSATMQRVKLFLSNFNDQSQPNKPITLENRTFESVFKQDSYQQVFFKNLTHEELVDLLSAANFMDIPKLQDACMCAVAIHLKKASLAYAKDVYGKETDFLEKPRPEDLELDI